MVAAARRTARRNEVAATFVNAVLHRAPTSATTTFYVRDEYFLASSLVPHPATTKISVPVLEVAAEIRAHATSYLIVDIEGAETDLLLARLPGCVRNICVECHPHVSQRADIDAMLASLLSQDFVLSVDLSRLPVMYFERQGEARSG